MTENRDKWLYLVAGERNIDSGRVRYANVGDAFDVEARLHDPDYARKAAGGKWLVLGKWNIGQHRDHVVHPLLKKRGLVFDPDGTGNTEEVAFHMPIEEAVALVGQCVNELLVGVSRKSSFGPRPEQQACVDRIAEWFGTPGNDGRFLVNAKMRFGKTLTMYWAAKRLQAKRVLVMTYKPAVRGSWQSDLEEHVDFQGVPFRKVDQGDAGPGVYFSSVQGAMADTGARTWMYSAHWDLVILDEEHYGTRTQTARDIFGSFSRAHRWVHLSGTPFRALLGGEFEARQTFTWSYEDEQEAKRASSGLGLASPYACLPTMQFLTYDFSSQLRSANSRLYSKEEQFTVSKLFAVGPKGDWVDPGAVHRFLDLLAGSHERTETRADASSPWHARLDPPVTPSTFKHTLWVMPSIGSCNAMKATLQQHDFFRGHTPIVAAGGGDAESVEHLRDQMARAGGKGTVTLTVQRFREGVTVPEWDAVFFLDDGRSPASYYQAAFRGQSPQAQERGPDGRVSRWKERCYVVDFNPHRLLEMVYDRAMIKKQESEEPQRSVREYVTQILDCAPIYRPGHATLRQVDVDEVMRVSISEKGFIDSFASAYAIDASKASDFADALEGLDPSRAAVLEKQVTDAGVERGKTAERKQTAGGKSQPGSPEAKALAELRDQALTLLKRIPSYLFLTHPFEETCGDILAGNAALFEDETGVSLDAFRRMVETGFVDREHLDSCILAFAEHERLVRTMQPLSPERYELVSRLLRKLHMTGTATATPQELVDQMLDKLPHETWADPTVRLLDPACGTGAFYVNAAVRLFRGLENAYPDETQRLEHILREQLFACDIDPKQLRRLRATMRAMGFDQLLKQFDTNVYNEDSLRRKWEMKFDVVIANPPFKAGMHLKFLQHSISSVVEEGHVLFIHPADFLVQKRPEPGGKRDDYKRLRDDISQKSACITFIDNPFNVGLYIPLSITHIVNTRGPLTFHDERTHAYGVKWFPHKEKKRIEHLDHVTGWVDGKVEASICDKILARARQSNWSGHLGKHDGQYYVSLSKVIGNGQTDVGGVTLHNMFSLGNRHTMNITRSPQIAKPQRGKSNGNVKPFVSFQTEKEASNAMMFLMGSKLMRFFIAQMKIDQDAAPGLMGLMPWLDWTRSWSHDELCELFQLDDSEKNLINIVWQMLTGEKFSYDPH